MDRKTVQPEMAEVRVLVPQREFGHFERFARRGVPVIDRQIGARKAVVVVPTWELVQAQGFPLVATGD